MAKYVVEFKDMGVVARPVEAEYWNLDHGQWFDFYDNDDSGENNIVMTVDAGEVRSITRTSG